MLSTYDCQQAVLLVKRFHWLSLYWGDAHVCTSRKSGQCYFLQWCEPDGGFEHPWVRRSGEGGGGGRMGFFTNYLIPMFLHRQDRILPFNFLILFLRATGGRGGGSAGWFRSNFRPPCQKLLDPVLFLFVAIQNIMIEKLQRDDLAMFLLMSY